MCWHSSDVFGEELFGPSQSNSIISLVALSWQVERNGLIAAEARRRDSNLRHIYISTEAFVGGDASSSKISHYEEMKIAPRVKTSKASRQTEISFESQSLILLADWAHGLAKTLSSENRPQVLVDNVRSPRSIATEVILREFTEVGVINLLQHTLHERLWRDRFRHKRLVLRILASLKLIAGATVFSQSLSLWRRYRALRTTLRATWSVNDLGLERATRFVAEEPDRELLVADGIVESTIRVVGPLEYLAERRDAGTPNALRPQQVVDFFTSGNFRFSKRRDFHDREIGVISHVAGLLPPGKRLRVWSKPGEEEGLRGLMEEMGNKNIEIRKERWPGFGLDHPQLAIAAAGSSVIVKAILADVPVIGFTSPQILEGTQINLAEQYSRDFVDTYSPSASSHVAALVTRTLQSMQHTTPGGGSFNLFRTSGDIDVAVKVTSNDLR